jgi:uncharacterized membrane protein
VKTPKATAFGSFGYGWQQLWKYFLHLFLIFLVVVVASAPTNAFIGGEHLLVTAGSVALNALVAAYAILVLPVVTFGSDWMYLRFMRDERANVADVFSGFKKNYLNIILANLLVFAIVGIGFVVFVIPGIIFACRLAFVRYLVMDKGLDPVTAIEKSWFMTRGHGWRIFGMYVLTILMFFCGLILFIVPGLLVLMWAGAAFASLYHAIDLEEQASLNQNGLVAA